MANIISMGPKRGKGERGRPEVPIARGMRRRGWGATVHRRVLLRRGRCAPGRRTILPMRQWRKATCRHGAAVPRPAFRLAS